MIKNLIAQLTAGKISLSSALKQAKVIVSYTSDKELGAFVNFELNGYKNEKDLPKYRIVPANPRGTYLNLYTGQRQHLPFSFQDTKSAIFHASHNRKFPASIPQIEELIAEKKRATKGELMEQYPPELLELQRQITENSEPWFLESACWILQPSAIVNIHSVTQDRLIDILLRILRENPNLDQELDYMSEQKDKANKTYQTTIHGDVIGSNLGVGDKLTQKDVTINNNPEVDALLSKIIQMGFSRENANELASLIDEEKKTGKLATDKILGWLARMTTLAVEKGIEYQIPQLIAAVTAYVHSNPTS